MLLRLAICIAPILAAAAHMQSDCTMQGAGEAETGQHAVSA